MAVVDVTVASSAAGAIAQCLWSNCYELLPYEPVKGHQAVPAADVVTCLYFALLSLQCPCPGQIVLSSTDSDWAQEQTQT